MTIAASKPPTTGLASFGIVEIADPPIFLGLFVINVGMHNSSSPGCDEGNLYFLDAFHEPSEYRRHAELVHRVLGAMIALELLIWTAFILRKLSYVSARATAGAVSLAAGVYLILSLFFAPSLWFGSRVSSVFLFTVHDLVQMQHLAIGVALAAAGVIDVYVARTRDRGPVFALAGLYHNMAVGLILLIHPQHAFAQSISHQVLGMCLTFAPVLFTFAQTNRFRFMYDAMVAASCYALAATMLILYKEPDMEHPGTRLLCSPAGTTTLILLTGSVGLMLLWAAALLWFRVVNAPALRARWARCRHALAGLVPRRSRGYRNVGVAAAQGMALSMP